VYIIEASANPKVVNRPKKVVNSNFFIIIASIYFFKYKYLYLKKIEILTFYIFLLDNTRKNTCILKTQSLSLVIEMNSVAVATPAPAAGAWGKKLVFSAQTPVVVPAPETQVDVPAPETPVVVPAAQTQHAAKTRPKMLGRFAELDSDSDSDSDSEFTVSVSSSNVPVPVSVSDSNGLGEGFEEQKSRGRSSVRKVKVTVQKSTYCMYGPKCINKHTECDRIHSVPKPCTKKDCPRCVNGTCVFIASK